MLVKQLQLAHLEESLINEDVCTEFIEKGKSDAVTIVSSFERQRTNKRKRQKVQKFQ